MAGHRCDRRRAWQWKSEPETFDMVTDIRERFLAGFTMRGELAFHFRHNPLVGDSLGGIDALALGRKYGAAWLPPSMQVSLPGRARDHAGRIEGIPARFGPEGLN